MLRQVLTNVKIQGCVFHLVEAIASVFWLSTKVWGELDKGGGKLEIQSLLWRRTHHMHGDWDETGIIHAYQN